MDNKIICAAVKVNDLIFRGQRHCHAIAAMHDKLSYTMNRQEIAKLNVENGFMTSEDKFVDRGEAMKIAAASGQVFQSKDHPASELYSEDLY